MPCRIMVIDGSSLTGSTVTSGDFYIGVSISLVDWMRLFETWFDCLKTFSSQHHFETPS